MSYSKIYMMRFVLFFFLSHFNYLKDDHNFIVVDD